MRLSPDRDGDGHDDRGEVATPGRRRHDRRVNLALLVAICNVFLFGVLGYGVSKNYERLELSETADIQTVRNAAWRLCERIQRDRALAHSLVAPDVLPLVEKQNPIVTCAPNLSGNPATALSIRDQRSFVQLWELGLLEPLPELPRCKGIKRPVSGCSAP